MRKHWFLLVVLGLATPAQAAEPYYFHRAGVSRETYIADVKRCQELAGGAHAPHVPTPYNPNIYANAAGAFFSGLFQGGADRRIKRAVERTCMADKGYARMQVSKAEIAHVLELKDEARMDGLFALASSPQPIGQRIAE